MIIMLMLSTNDQHAVALTLNDTIGWLVLSTNHPDSVPYIIELNLSLIK